MKRVTVTTGDSKHVMEADTMTLHGDMLYVYDGDMLVGMFREETVKTAYMTEQKA